MVLGLCSILFLLSTSLNFALKSLNCLSNSASKLFSFPNLYSFSEIPYFWQISSFCKLLIRVIPSVKDRPSIVTIPPKIPNTWAVSDQWAKPKSHPRRQLKSY